MSKVCLHGDDWIFTHPKSGSWCVACLTKKNGELSTDVAELQAEVKRIKNLHDEALQKSQARKVAGEELEAIVGKVPFDIVWKIVAETDECPPTMNEEECDDPDREGSCRECWNKYVLEMMNGQHLGTPGKVCGDCGAFDGGEPGDAIPDCVEGFKQDITSTTDACARFNERES